MVSTPLLIVLGIAVLLWVVWVGWAVKPRPDSLESIMRDVRNLTERVEALERERKLHQAKGLV